MRGESVHTKQETAQDMKLNTFCVFIKWLLTHLSFFLFFIDHLYLLNTVWYDTELAVALAGCKSVINEVY